MADLTPMRRQYQEIKAQHEDCILFFRLGDFYEMFEDDALLASRELELTLTTRDRGKAEEERIPMCGVPYHSSEAYIARLIAKGYKVAICEQTEDPALAKGLVRRDVIRVVTPGTVTDASMLDEGRNNFICSVYMDTEGAGFCACDISTGEIWATAASGQNTAGHMVNELGRYAPREAVLSDGAFSCGEITRFLSERLCCRAENGGEGRFQEGAARTVAERQFGDEPQLRAAAPEAVRAVGGLLSYLYETQKTDLSYLKTLRVYAGGQFMELDYAARRNLELTETMREKEKKGTLLWVLDRTKTPMGRRLIRNWMERPLLEVAAIRRRLDAVDELTRMTVAREELILALRGVTDLERLVGKAVYGSVNCRDLAALGGGLSHIPALRERLAPFRATLLRDLAGGLDSLDDLCALLAESITDDPPFSVREGGFIRDGYHEELDRLRRLQSGGRDAVAAIEAAERERTGIRSLKIGYNKVFGYYIEVSKSNYELVPETYIRKQTLANCERFITQELKELEQGILSARSRIEALEYEIFTQLRGQAAACVARVQKTAAAVAQADALASFAAVAAAHGYCMPEVDASDRLDIVEGRHPVVERMLSDGLFVPNDTEMDCGENQVAIITGPNMAGKSTYMRQVALIALMAQIGSFVPAKRARIGVTDRIFTRVGAADDLAAGQSTFMVEMTEVAEILKNATAKSLLILDEIGRGTATYDGMSIARAVLEYCCEKRGIGAKTLFATHYHELCVLEETLRGVKNFNIAVKKRGEEIIFLRKIVRGGADRSYGVEVARLAGVPERVVSRARALLREMEAQGAPSPPPRSGAEAETGQLSMGDVGALEAAVRIRSLDLSTLTPLEALNLLYELQKQVG